MKNFPRIYSLCTVGLIHHGEYEYLFHPFRTDFIGDSGAGKSMIADLLQLILVGSDKFESATEVSGEKRTSDGMVLTTTEKGGIGYAFLNVEVAPKQYIIVGTSLQSGNQRTRAFVAQAGDLFSGNSLKPLSSPLGYSALIRHDDNAILPLDSLSMHLFEQGVIVRPYEQFADFHDLLIANKLLPLKPTADQQTLSDYATIIRSFARGYKVRANKSDALQKFLFGRTERDNLLSKLHGVQRNIEKNIQSHGHNLEAIEDFNVKLTDFKVLLRKENKQKWAKKEWVLANYHFTCQTRDQSIEAVTAMCQRLNTDFARLTAIRPVVDAFQTMLPEAVKAAQTNLQTAIQKQSALTAIGESVASVQNWLVSIGPAATLDQLTEKFNIDQKRRKQRQSIDTLMALLLEKKLIEVFTNSAWTKGYEAGYNEYRHKLETLDASIREKQQLVLLTNLDDPTSLSYWASRLNRPLTIEEESVLRHFQNLPTTKPTSKSDKRYIPSAEALFDRLQMNNDDIPENYWANLSGVWERIQQVKDPLFTTDDKEALQEKLRRWSSHVQKEIGQLTEELKTLTDLFTCLSHIADLNSLLIAYTEHTQVDQFKFNQDWAIAPGDFEKLLTSYRTHASTIDSEIEQTNKDVQAASYAFSEASQRDRWLDDGVCILKAWPQPKQYIDALDQLLPNRPDFIIHTDRLLDDPADSDLKILHSDLITRNQNQVVIDHWRDKLTSLSHAEQQQQVAEKEFWTLYDHLPSTSIDIGLDTLGELRQSADQTWILYKAEYDRLAEHYLKEQKYTVDDPTYNFMTLAHEVLPPSLRKTIKSADEIISAIELELHRINNQARQIADSIIRKVGEVVAQLGQIINEHQKAQRAIQKFFQNQTIPITNKCIVRLEWRRGELSTDWITAFADLIDRLDTPLFQPNSIEIDSLRTKMDVEELLKTAFKQANNGKSLDIKNILDPFAYYELSFGMYYENGQPNKGSTGQTYAALALLSVARLSVIEAGSPDNPAPGLRIIPIDEAEGLGSNFTMLADIARQYDYQLIAMSIGPVGRYQESEQHVYMLHKDQETDEAINYPPFGILSAQDAHLMTYRYDAKN